MRPLDRHGDDSRHGAMQRPEALPSTFIVTMQMYDATLLVYCYGRNIRANFS
jgi:hypothetical protein